MYALSRRATVLLHALDGFVLAAVGSLVLLHIAPHALALGGAWSIVAGGIGLAIPALGERMVLKRRARGWALAMGLVGLVSHTVIDGAAIGSEQEAGALSWAIVLHRLPAGILVWWLVRPAFGLKRASLMLAGLIAATIAGFVLGTRFEFVEERSLAVFEAMVAGALLHILLNHGPELHGETGPHNRAAELLGAALGVATVALAPEASGHEHAVHALGSGKDLIDISYAVALPLIFGFAAAGALATSKLAPRARGLLAAFLRPVGAAGAAREVRATGDLLALAATPQLGPPVLAISLVLLGPLFTLVRAGAAIIASIAVALIARPAGAAPHGDPHRHDEGPGSALVRALRFGLADLVDESAAWILLGVAAYLALRGASIDVPSLLSVPLAALIALFPFVCATGATPLAAAAVTAGLSPGTALAFLIAGATLHASSLSAVASTFDRRTAVRFGAATFGMATLLGLAADRLLPQLSPPLLTLALDDSLDRASAILLLTLIAASLVRLGPRGFIQTLFRPPSSESAPHLHHHHE